MTPSVMKLHLEDVWNAFSLSPKLSREVQLSAARQDNRVGGEDMVPPVAFPYPPPASAWAAHAAAFIFPGSLPSLKPIPSSSHSSLQQE